MKYLLSILILFSGLSFSTSYLICDEPYVFYPDKERRLLIELKDSSITTSSTLKVWKSNITLTRFYIDSFEGDEFKETIHAYFWYKSKLNKFRYLYWIDRKTLVLNSHIDPEDEKDSEKPKCNLVSDKEFFEAQKELEKLADDLTNKAISDQVEELEKRKI